MTTTVITTAITTSDYTIIPNFFKFVPGTIVLSRTVYKGTADTITIGENLPPGCQPAGSAAPRRSAAEPSATFNVPLLPADQPPATTAVAGFLRLRER